MDRRPRALHHNICPTNILWHREFDDGPWKVKISWAFNSALPLKKRQGPLFLWRKSGRRAVAGVKRFEEVWRGKTWHVFVGLKFNVATPMVQRKIKTWLFGILICFGPFVIQNCKSFFFVMIDSGKQLTTLLVRERRMKSQERRSVKTLSGEEEIRLDCAGQQSICWWIIQTRFLWK